MLSTSENVKFPVFVLSIHKNIQAPTFLIITVKKHSISQRKLCAVED